MKTSTNQTLMATVSVPTPNTADPVIGTAVDASDLSSATFQVNFSGTSVGGAMYVDIQVSTEATPSNWATLVQFTFGSGTGQTQVQTKDMLYAWVRAKVHSCSCDSGATASVVMQGRLV